MDTVVKAATPEEIKRAEQKANGGAASAVVEDDEVEYLVELPEPVTIKLKHGMRYKGVDYHEATVSPFVGENFRPMQMMMNIHGPEVGMAASLTGLPAAVLKKMAAVDFAKVQKVVQDFLPQELLAGEESEPTGDSGLNT